MKVESCAQASELGDIPRRMRTRLLAALGLEVRDPLAAIAGLADLVLEGRLDGEQREYVALIRKVTGDLIRLLDEAISLMELEVQQSCLLDEEFNLREVIQAVINDLGGAGQAGTGEGYEVEIAGDLPGLVRGDPIKLRQLVEGVVRSSAHTCLGGQARFHVSCEPGPHGWLLVVKGSCFPRIPAYGDGGSRGLQGEFQALEFASAAFGWALVYRLTTLMGGSLSLSIKPLKGGQSELVVPLGRVEESG